MPYVLRICMPRRDWGKVADLVEQIESCKVVRRTITRLFPTRPDLDAVEIVMIVYCSPGRAKAIDKELALRVNGTIGFYLMYQVKG